MPAVTGQGYQMRAMLAMKQLINHKQLRSSTPVVHTGLDMLLWNQVVQLWQQSMANLGMFPDVTEVLRMQQRIGGNNVAGEIPLLPERDPV